MNQPILVIMAGGRGERFWPCSRRNNPKQLLSFFGEQSLLQATVNRIRELTTDQRIYVVTNRDYAEEARKQLSFLPVQNMLVEPESRNTAPCIGLAATYIAQKIPNEDPVIGFLPSDSMVLNPEEFRRILRAGFTIGSNIESGVIFGMRPTRPETGFGYIQLGKEIGVVDSFPYHEVAAFKEKPNREIAEQYLVNKDFLWNGGIFVWRLSILQKEIQEYLPRLDDGFKYFKQFIGTDEENERLKEVYSILPSISVDYGILEKTPKRLVIPTANGWDDLGSWSALERVHTKDEFGNVIQGEHIGVETKGCIVYSPKKMVATLGVAELIMVETDDVLLVCPKDQAQEIKKLLQKINALKRIDLL